MPIAESMTRDVVKSIRLMESKCIRLNGHEPNWRALFLEHLDDISRCESPADFERRVNSVLSRGGLSHVAFFHDSAQRAPARYAINATFCAVDTRDGSRWVFEDVHEGGPAHDRTTRSERWGWILPRGSSRPSAFGAFRARPTGSGVGRVRPRGRQSPESRTDSGR